MYLVAVMVWHSRKVLSWGLCDTMETDFCLEAAEEAIRRYGTPDEFNYDLPHPFAEAA